MRWLTDQFNRLAQNAYVVVLALVIIFLAVGVLEYVYDLPRARSSSPDSGEIGAQAVGTGRFTNIYGTLQTAAQANVTSLGTLTALTVNGAFKLTPSSVITVTDSAAFTVTNGINNISAADAVTPTLTIPAAGIYVCIYNSSSNNILIQDTGNQVLGGNRTLGQYDVLCGFSDGTRFIEVGFVNN